MNIKGNTRIEGEAVVESLPISASSLSTLVEVGGLLHKRQFSDIVLQPKEAYIPGLSVSFPSIFNLNTESLDYNNRSLVVSLKNQLAGTALLAPVTLNGTPAFRRIVKSDLTDAGVVFSDDNYVRDVQFSSASKYGDRITVHRNTSFNNTRLGSTVIDTRSKESGLGSDGSTTYLPNRDIIPSNTTFSLFHYLNGNWHSSIITKGWNSTYAAWKISGYASTGGGVNDYYLSSTLADGSWGVDNKIWHSGNVTELQNSLDFVKKSGDTMTGVLNLQNTLGEKLAVIRTSNTINSSIKFGVSDGVFNIGAASKDIFAIGNDADINKGDSRWMWVQRDGSIFSRKDGNSIQWKQAYDWGNFRDYGLGLEATVKLTDGNIKPSYNSFEGPAGQNSINFPDKYSPVISLSRTKDYSGYIQLNRLGTLHWKSWNGATNMNTWRTAWDNVNLTKLSQLQNDSNFSTQTLTAGANIQINGNVISATDTKYQGGSLPMLIAGTDNIGSVWTAKTLNDWVNTKIKPSVLEYTLQEGITNPLWSSNATGKYSVAIGSYANATGYNSLALLQGARAEGYNSLAIGEYSQALGTRSVAIGSYTTSINESYSFGFAVTNSQAGCVAIGEFNADIPFADGRTKTNNSETPLFIIGNGLSSMIRSNAQVTYRDGSTRNYGRQYYDETMRSTIDFTKDNTLADVKYVKENGGGGLPNNPFTSISSNGYAGDTIDNPKFIGTKPNNLDVVVINIERSQGLNMWTKADGYGTKGSLYGVYLSSHNKILLRGYYRNTNTGQVNHTSMLFDTTSKQTLFMLGMPLDLKYVLLGNIVDGQTGLILFNPR